MNITNNIKRLIKKSIVSSRMLRLLTEFTGPGVAILRYHSIQDKPEDYADTIGIGIMHSTSIFKEQMEFVSKYFSPVTMDEVLGFMKGEFQLPKRAVAVTFDDGFEDNYTIAAPIMNELGIASTIYVKAGSVESKQMPWYMRLRYVFTNSKNKNYVMDDGYIADLSNDEQSQHAFFRACEQCAKLTGEQQEEKVSGFEDALVVDPYQGESNLILNWEQVKKLREQGHIIGSHTISHPNMAYVTNDDELLNEFVRSKALLEEKLKEPVLHFAYPSPILQPHWDERTREVSKAAGYEAAVTCTPGKVVYGDNPLSIKRIGVPFDKYDFFWEVENSLVGRVIT